MSNSSIITNHTNSNHHHPSNRISNGTQACAACKYQRRKCAHDCVLAPYFPHDRQRQFLNAHKLFGVSNITKIIRTLSPPDKDMAMRTIIFQSDARAKDPVGGCYRIIAELNHQYEFYRAELDLVLQQLQFCKAQVYQQQHAQLFQMANNVGLTQPLEGETQVEGAESSPAGDHNNQGSNELVTCDNENYQQYQALMRYYYDEGDHGNTGEQQYLPVPQQQQEQHQNDQYSWVAPPNEDALLASSNSSTSHGECFVMKSDFGGECEGLEMKPQIQIDANGASYDEDREFGNKFDDSSTHIDLSCCDLQGGVLKFDPNQRTELSGDLMGLKKEKIVLENPEDETFHHIPEHNLRNAATLFTLTN